MAPAVLELNDQSLLIGAAEGSLYSEPGFARLTPQGIETGETARGVAWLEPQHSYNQYWCQLNETPLPARQRWARHHADIAFAQLRQVWRSAGEPEAMVVLVPGSFSDAQLSLLLGMIGALPSRALTVIDSALAACLGAERDLLFVDLQLHQSVLSLCRARGQSLEIADQETFPDLGLLQIQNSVARHISNLLIDSHRYDPLHASASEQAIFDQLPEWLTRLGWESEISTAVESEQGEIPFTLRRDKVRQLLGERLANVRSFIQRHRGTHPLLSHSAGLLAGLSDEFAAADVAGQAAGAGNCLAHLQQILDQVDGLYRVRALEVGSGPGPEEGAVELATHVLDGNRALPLHRPVSFFAGNEGMHLSSELDTASALTLVLRNRSLQVVHVEEDTDISLPQSCVAGESITVGGREFRLIEVQDG